MGAVYVAVSVVVLFPVLATPVIADDLFNPFGQFDVVGPGPISALNFGWDGATNGASFRITGNPIGALYNWLWLTVGAQLGVSLTTFFAITKLVVFVSVVAAIAWSWHHASRLYARRPISLGTAMGWVSVALFGSVQIHAGWSNDPVADYPLAGYGAAALGFVTIGAAARLARSRRMVDTIAAAAAGSLAVTYYEMNVGAVIGATAFLAVVLVSDARLGRFDHVYAARALIVPVLPAALVVAGRFVTSEQSAANYSGTTVRLEGAATTFARGAWSSLPASAWRLAIDHLGGQLGVVFFVFGAVLLVALAVRWLCLVGEPTSDAAADIVSSTRHDEPLDPGSGSSERAPDRWAGVGFTCAVAVYAVFSLALQSVTVKVQDEAPAIGYVYTWYAMTSSAVALLIAVVARRVAARPRGLAKTLAIALAIGLLFVQNTVNWRLSEQLNRDFGANRHLLDAFDPATSVDERCDTLVQWQSIRWPAYYEGGIVDGLQESFEHYFDEPFCPFGEGDG